MEILCVLWTISARSLKSEKSLGVFELELCGRASFMLDLYKRKTSNLGSVVESEQRLGSVKCHWTSRVISAQIVHCWLTANMVRDGPIRTMVMTTRRRWRRTMRRRWRRLCATASHSQKQCCYRQTGQKQPCHWDDRGSRRGIGIQKD